MRSPAHPRILSGVLLGALLALAGCGSEARAGPHRPSVLVIAIDALRADHVRHLGYDRPTTPALDRLAADGVSFRSAFATAPLLLPSHVSLLTGCDPNVARRLVPLEISAPLERRWHVPTAVPHLAAEFLVHGYRTAAFVESPLLSKSGGFATGFQEYAVVEDTGGRADPPHPERLVSRFQQWLRGLEPGEPWFAYLQLHTLEEVWTRSDSRWEDFFPPRLELREIPPVGSTDSTFFAIPRSRWRGGFRSLGQYEAIYDGHVRRLDEELDRLLGSLRVAGRYEDTTLVVVGSFGVQFGEAGLYLSSGAYSMADLRVPVVIRPAQSVSPPDLRRGRQVDAVFSLIDLAPTLLELCGLERPRGMHGVSQRLHVLDQRLPAPFPSGVSGDAPGDAPGDRNAEPPPLRRNAFASCGFQEGRAAIGERWTLEYFVPDMVGSPLLERSWFGENRGREDSLMYRFYDRRADPFPPLVTPRDPNDLAAREAETEMRREASEWFKNVHLARTVLQGGVDPDEPEGARIARELRELGFLR